MRLPRASMATGLSLIAIIIGRSRARLARATSAPVVPATIEAAHVLGIARLPMEKPSSAPTKRPSMPPSKSPSHAPSRSPSNAPASSKPSALPSKKPAAPTKSPTFGPTESPSRVPSRFSAVAKPTQSPSRAPSTSPATSKISTFPGVRPTSYRPSRVPSRATVPRTTYPTKQQRSDVAGAELDTTTGAAIGAMLDDVAVLALAWLLWSGGGEELAPHSGGYAGQGRANGLTKETLKSRFTGMPEPMQVAVQVPAPPKPDLSRVVCKAWEARSPEELTVKPGDVVVLQTAHFFFFPQRKEPWCTQRMIRARRSWCQWRCWR